MNRIERLAAILLLLQDRPRTSFEIADHFEVSRRTILRDIQALSEMGVPVIAREGPGGGYSLPDSYRAEPLPLTRNEAFLLLLALNSLERLSDLPFRVELRSLLTKIQALLPSMEASAAHGLLQSVSVDVPTREQQAPFLETMLEAARQGRWMRVVYRSAERASTQHLLPRQVYSQSGFWYCQADSHERGERRTYRIDRIQAAAPPEPDFQPNPIPEPAPYNHPDHPQIVVRLTDLGLARIEVDRHLGAFVRHLPDGGGELAFRCPPEELDWFARYFLAFGLEAQVLAPSELQERILKFARDLIVVYQKR